MLRALDRWAARLLLGAGGTLAAVSALFSAGRRAGGSCGSASPRWRSRRRWSVGALAGLPRPSFSREAVVALGFFAAFVAWNGVSVIWSIEGDRSWAYFNRGLVYLAFAVVGLWLGPWVREWAYVLAGVLALPLGWALLGKAIPALGSSGRVARLSSPIGYWNALGLLFAMARAARALAGGAAGAPALAARGRRGLPLRARRRAAADLFARRRAGGGRGRSCCGSCSARRGSRAPRRCCSAAAPGSGSRSGRSRGRGSPRTGSRIRCASTTAPGSRSSSCSRRVAVAALAYLGSLAEERRPLTDARRAAGRAGRARRARRSGVAVGVVALVVGGQAAGLVPRVHLAADRRLAAGRPAAPGQRRARPAAGSGGRRPGMPGTRSRGAGPGRGRSS